MLEQVDLGLRIEKDVYRSVREDLDIRLSTAQRAMMEAKTPVIIVFEGWSASGIGTAIGRLLAPLDPRGYKVLNFLRLDSDIFFRPQMWPFWLALPPAGAIGVFDGSWYQFALAGKKKKQALERIRAFERQQSDSGAVVIKFWMHIDKKEQARRFKKLEKNPAQSWMVSKSDWRQNDDYERRLRQIEQMLAATDTENAPWIPIPANDARTAALIIGEELVARLNARLKAAQDQVETATAPVLDPLPKKNVLDEVDLSLSLDEETYQTELSALQKRLLDLEHRIYTPRIPVVIAYEGWDASGKGGNIKRLVSGLDHRGFEVIPVGAPQGEEKTHHYLWRFWKNLPKGGHITIFDRSWYGRVMVERIENLTPAADWQRAYQEIREFESELLDSGAVLIKFWIHISKQEQLKRFRQRERTPHKQWKITEEDWRNRRKWNQYYAAVNEMIQRTSTENAPWTVIEGNQKWYARVKALRTVCDAIEQKLK